MEYKTESITVKVRADDIVEVTNNADWQEADTIETATKNANILKKAIGGKNRALLSHMPNTYVTKEVLNCYVSAEIGEVAIALMTSSFASKIVGTLYLKLITGKIKMKEENVNTRPVEIFTKKEAAEKWLLAEIAKNR